MINNSKISNSISTLIIEDNEGDFILVEDYLLEKFNSIKIKHCINYQESISYLESHNSTLSIIFLDIHLPDLSGTDLIKNILFYSCKVPIIILTGYTDISLARLSLQQGIYDFLIKDELNPSLLQKSIDFALSRRHFIEQIDKERVKFENLFNFSPQPTWLIKKENFEIIDANYSAIEKYGYSLHDYQKMSFLELHPIDEKETITNTIFKNTYESEKKHFTHFLKDSSQIKVKIHCKEVNFDFENNGIILQSTDITQTLYYTNVIEDQNNKLKNIAWTQSHVVRAPLSRILGIINLLEDIDGDKDNLIYWLSELKNSSNEMDSIVNKIINETKSITSNE